MPIQRYFIRRLIRPALVLLAALFLPGLASALPFKWEPVTLDPRTTGAACGDGSPYRFFVNRNPLSRNVSVVFEPGGICASGDTCAGNDDQRTAFNPNGIPADYMTRVETGIAANVSPMSRRFKGVSSADWNLVFLPYCTGDLHTGTAVNTYRKSDGTTRIQYHVGLNNMKAVASWMKRNGFANPPKLLVNGMSAGSVASVYSHAYLRAELNPGQAYMIADSALVPPAPKGGREDRFPSVRTQEIYDTAFGLRARNGLIDTLLSLKLQNFDPENLSSIYRAVSTTFPRDRFLYLAFQEDENLPVSGYSFNSRVQAIPSWDAGSRRELRKTLYKQDLRRILDDMSQMPNFGFWVPLWRAGNSHCVTLVTFLGTSIEELGQNDARMAIENTLDDSKPMIRAFETDQTSDYSPSRWYNFALSTLTSIEAAAKEDLEKIRKVISGLLL